MAKRKKLEAGNDLNVSGNNFTNEQIVLQTEQRDRWRRGGLKPKWREVYRYASVTSLSQVIGTTSIKFLDQPIGKRNFLGFRNASTSNQIIYIDFSSQATVNSWLQLTPGTTILFDTVVPQDDLYAIADAAGGQLAYAYSTFGG
jgi:hypothetical protein